MKRTCALGLVLGMSACVAFAACGGTSGSDVIDPAGDGGADASNGTGSDGSSQPATDSGGTNPDGGNGGVEGGNPGKDASVPPLPDGGVAGVPGVVLWLDSAKGITPDLNVATKVAKWADQSGNGNDAAIGNVNVMPSIVANGINGLPVVHFTATVSGQAFGNILNIADSATLQWGTGDYTIEVVTRYDNQVSATPATETATGYGTLYLKQTFAATPAGVAFFANTPATASASGTTAMSSFVDTAQGLSGTAGFNDGTARVLGTQRIGATTLALRVNGHQIGSATVASTDVDNIGTGARIGANGDATTARLDGDIAEIIAIKGAVTASDLAAIEGYLTNKYGL